MCGAGANKLSEQRIGRLSGREFVDQRLQEPLSRLNFTGLNIFIRLMRLID